MTSVHILNGPNLNLLGRRQPHIYGTETLQDVERACCALGAKLGLNILFLQSNSESELIDWVHEAREYAQAIIINPAAFTHYSIALLDALNTFDGLIVEVHISNVHQREQFRHRSFVSLRANAVMAGFGTHGYELAVRHASKILGEMPQIESVGAQQ